MGALKTFLFPLALTAAAGSPPSPADAAAPLDQVRIFATCTGRLSAQMEYQWMFDGPGSEVTETTRAALIDILDAIVPADAGPEVLHWRIEAKAAQAALLDRAVFNSDRDDAQMAQRIARRQIDACRALLLG
ncbi:hypothetical protein [Thalassovita aquimarina]|uniref:Uncharacterized protein n=1 Tax=Thalassovita aquimarina TaxID=2785917 RepID=A0ABS5HSV8_9RHOB|nr:hypothetical protein [Thalassovita aquimarina]MBR9652041.1 hypothetical protein [Thalassovita aquimarina]